MRGWFLIRGSWDDCFFPSASSIVLFIPELALHVSSCTLFFFFFMNHVIIDLGTKCCMQFAL